MSEKDLRRQLGERKHVIPSTHMRTAQVAKESQAVVEPRKAATDFLSVKMELHSRLIEDLENRGLLNSGASDEAVVDAVRTFVEEVVQAESLPINAEERERLADELAEETLGIGPLAPLMADPAVTDILVNGCNRVYVDRFGKMEKTSVRFQDNAHLLRLIQRIVARVGRHIDEASPMVDARLSDGTRINATVPPVSLDGPTLSIRRFGRRRFRLEDLMRLGMLNDAMAHFLGLCVRGKLNLAISGGSGAGKSTVLGALAENIPHEDRVITIEDTAELQLDQDHVVRMETRAKNIEGHGAITARDLVINALRMRPDRIIVGEVRGPEALDMLQAMNTGHEGSMTTLHANSPRDAMARLETMVLMAGADLPSLAIREQFVSALNILAHVKRFEDGVRRISQIVEIVGIEEGTPQTQTLFEFRRRAQSASSYVEGVYEPTGLVPRSIEVLKERGIEVPLELFRK